MAKMRVEYFVEPSLEAPRILARVRWPDIAEAIRQTAPTWSSLPELDKMRFDSWGAKLTKKEAAKIASDWGSSLPDD